MVIRTFLESHVVTFSHYPPFWTLPFENVSDNSERQSELTKVTSTATRLTARLDHVDDGEGDNDDNHEINDDDDHRHHCNQTTTFSLQPRCYASFYISLRYSASCEFVRRLF